jgi:hypothetical protein
LLQETIETPRLKMILMRVHPAVAAGVGCSDSDFGVGVDFLQLAI